MNNDFINNGDLYQIRDNGTDNKFLNNFYNEWTSPDYDSNGFVDKPYLIEGDAESEDKYPRAAPYNPIPEWYEYIPVTNPPSSTTTTTSEVPPPLPITEISLAVVGIFIVAGIVIVLIRRRG